MSETSPSGQSTNGRPPEPSIEFDLYGGRTEEEVAMDAIRNRHAFGELFDANFDPLYAYVYKVAGNEEEAEEIVEDIFGSTLEAIERKKFKKEHKKTGILFRNWLFGQTVENLNSRYGEVHYTPNRGDLTYEERTVLGLYYAAGFSVEEACEIAGYTIEEFEDLYATARARVATSGE